MRMNLNVINIQIILGNDGRLLTILPIKNKHFEVDESNKEVTDELKSIKKRLINFNNYKIFEYKSFFFEILA